MKREPVINERRRAPTLKEQVAILKRQALCFMCREPLREKKQVEFDHAIPLAIGGKNDVSNLNALCPACHRKKTDADLAIIAKAKRRALETGQQARRAKRDRPLLQTRNTLGKAERDKVKAWKESIK